MPAGWNYIAASSIVCAAMLGHHPATCQAAPKGPDAKPNVLFLMMDDLNSWVGYHGEQPNVQTPNIDALAARGVWFRRAYCQAPACNASRTSMMFGLLPSTSGIYSNYQNMRYGLRDNTSMPQHFRNHGYFAQEIGKVFHDGDRTSWDFIYGCGISPSPEKFPAHGVAHLENIDWAGFDEPADAWGDAQLADAAVEFLSQSHEQPFFLGVGLVKPHLFWYVPQEYFDLYPLEEIVIPQVKEDDLDDIPPAGQAMASLNLNPILTQNGLWDDAVRGYLASISYADAQLGRVIEALDNGPHAGNTIIVLCSDHGFHLGEKNHWKKDTLWEVALRVPLVVVAPDVTPAGAPCEQPVGLVSLFRTLSQLCGIPELSDIEGESLVPLLEDPAAPWEGVATSTEGYKNHSVRTMRWHYIRYEDGSEELYDHQTDPLEWHNLAGLPGMDGIKAELAEHLPKVDTLTVFLPPSRIYVDPTATGTGTGLTWANAFTDIRHAFNVTRNNTGRDFEVWVAKGTYTPAPPGGVRTSSFPLGNAGRNILGIYGGFDGTEFLREQRDPLANPCVLSGDLNGDDNGDPETLSDNAYHVLISEGVLTGFVTLDGFVIRGGNADGEGWNSVGGGMYFERSSPMIRNCRFEQNTATRGGAVYISGGGRRPAKPEFVNCAFVDNTALTNGAAVLIDDRITAPTSCEVDLQRNALPVLTHLTVAENNALGLGGGVFTVGSSRPDIANSIFWQNTDAAGATEDAQIHGGVLTINYSTVQGWTGEFGGQGNIGLNPLFSTNSPAGISLRAESPCIHAGDPGFVPTDPYDLAHRPRIECGRVDMGAVEYTKGDADSDGEVSAADMAAWLDCAAGPDVAAVGVDCDLLDFDDDQDVDLPDFAGFAIRMANCSQP